MLLDRGYPEAASNTLVGDRYRLTREERHILFRGVSPTAVGAARRRRLVAAPSQGARIGIDGHNVVLTVANYLRGVAVFVADDGLVRDIGGIHGRLHDAGLMERAIGLVADALRELSADEIVVCLDRPLSHSADHAALFSELLGRGRPPDDRLRVVVADSADAELVRRAPTIIATSDSGLIDRVGATVWDLARAVLQRWFFPTLEHIPPRGDPVSDISDPGRGR